MTIESTLATREMLEVVTAELAAGRSPEEVAETYLDNPGCTSDFHSFAFGFAVGVQAALFPGALQPKLEVVPNAE
jgi:uncharacterized protein (DUF2062 family)